MTSHGSTRPTLGLLYLDHVLRFFDRSNFKGWPDKIEQVVYHWGNDKQRFIEEIKRKKIDVLIGNIPATAYETFREISRALPEVQFVPSLDSQFCNKSKENVTHFCHKHDLPIPRTEIFYQVDEALDYLSHTTYPKIVKRSYGPSNYGGYFVHKVDSEAEALRLFAKKQYYPAYIQDFVPMKADIRVMLVGHQPVCAFWRRPPEGEWLTNTSQGGSMDYQAVPEKVLDVAVKASKAANAEYWACDIAVSMDDDYTILECATAFAAFPYIRDWIGQYLMWLFAPERFKKPYFAHRNWEELGKIQSSLLRTLRHLSFGETSISTDTGEYAPHDSAYPLARTYQEIGEEWPSEVWNRQGLLAHQLIAPSASQLGEQSRLEAIDTGIESLDSLDLQAQSKSEHLLNSTATKPNSAMNQAQLVTFFTSIKGIGLEQANKIITHLGVEQTLTALNSAPNQLMTVPGIKQKKCDAICLHWNLHCKALA
nr:helix-hairpin-helix domain-containing protein [uncultured Vibrio sp.]